VQVLGARVAEHARVKTAQETPELPSLSPFEAFARTGEEIASTSKRLEKAASIARYFATLSDEDLARAARYFGGFVFPLREGRTVNVGAAALMSAIHAVAGGDEGHWRERLVVLGDAGDVAHEALASGPCALREPHLRLCDVEAFFATLAATSGSGAKRALLTQALQRATPLEAKYLVKLLSGDLRIGLKEGAVEEAIARAASVPVAQVQRANMLSGDIGETALAARHGRLGHEQMALFHPLKFMLASPASDLEEVARQMPASFAVEDKFDGIRAQAHIGPHEGAPRAALFSRTLDDISGAFPDLCAPLLALIESPASTSGLVLDGEIVPIDPQSGAVLPFQVLQKRLGRKAPSAQVLAEIPVAFIAYDALFGGGRILFEEAWTQRREVLEALFGDPQVLASTHKRVLMARSELHTGTQELDGEFDAARARGNEGLMVKDPRASYKPGRRGKEWLKIKKALATLDVVITSAEVGNGRRAKFLSDYTFAVRASDTDGTLLNVGKAYSGLTDVEIAQLSEQLKAHTIQEFAHGKVRVVEPKIVLEVTFDRVQPSPRHKSGYALRFPRILRIRDDKPVGEIDTLEAVKKLAE
jgi:DNA ligase-1